VDTLTPVAAENIRAWRARRRLRRRDLGEALGLAQRTVADIEAGRRPLTLPELPLVCEALGITLAQLFEGAAPELLAALGLQGGRAGL
jgi:transcriptional regulator with XRE-family HTH domain